MMNKKNSRLPSYSEVCEIIGNAFREDMKKRNVQYTVFIEPKRNQKLEIHFDG